MTRWSDEEIVNLVRASVRPVADTTPSPNLLASVRRRMAQPHWRPSPLDIAIAAAALLMVLLRPSIIAPLLIHF